MKTHEFKDSMQRVDTPAMRSDEDFWSDFRARARLHPQHAPAPQPAMPRIMPWMATACAAVLIATLVFFPFGREPEQASEILAVDVLARHSGVMIMNEGESEGTILWICDMETETGGDST